MSKILDQLRLVDPILSKLAQGYSNEEFIADKVFPVVEVQKSGGKIPLFGKESFNVYATARAVGGDSNRRRANPGNYTTANLQEHDMEFVIDYLEEAESFFNLKKHNTFLATEAVRLSKEKNAADLLQNAALYADTNKVTLTTNQFNDTDSKPIDIIKECAEKLRKQISRRPNVLVMGASIKQALMEHDTVLDRIKYSQKGVTTVQLLAELLDIPNIFVGTATYADTDGAMNDIWGDNIMLLYQSPLKGATKTSMYNPGYGYTLRKANHPVVDTYSESGGKLMVIRSTDNYEHKVTGQDAAYLIKDCLQ